MVNGYATAAQMGLRAALVADARVTDLVGQRVLDHVPEGVIFPYIEFGIIEPQADDADGTTGAAVQVQLIVHSRPQAGRVEAAGICQAIRAVLHRADGLDFSPFSLTDILVDAYSVQREGDGATYRGRVALEVHLA